MSLLLRRGMSELIDSCSVPQGSALGQPLTSEVEIYRGNRSPCAK